METNPLRPEDRRLVLLCVAMLLASGIFVRYNYTRAFPQASIRLERSKAEITALASQFLSRQGLAHADCINLTFFSPDTVAQFYLERELGLEQANRLMSGEVPVWRWRARWFQPPRKEEFVVELSPSGRLLGFDHVMEESAPGARLGPAQARSRAEEFVRSHAGRPFRLVEERAEQRPNRLDHFFTFEREDFRARNARIRYSVTVKGGEVGAYRAFLYVPEAWQRDFARMRSRNQLYSQLALALYVPLILAAVILLARGLARREILWRAPVTVSVVVGVLNMAAEWNSLPFFVDEMPTSSPYWQSAAFGILQGLGAGVLAFFYVLLAAAPGEVQYRRLLPGLPSVRDLLRLPALRSRAFFRACLAGYALTAAHIAFVVAFYLAGAKLGVWSPQEVPYSDLLGTWAPWLYPLTISLLAATSEEFWFRLLAVPLLLGLVRSRWLAVLAPAFVWGFLHANYPQQPAWIRGLEVGLIGVVAGWVMLRFGIAATLIWHYTVDAVFIGTFLLDSGNWRYQLAGIAVAGLVLLPFAASVFFYRRNGGFLEDLEPPPAKQDAPAVPVPPASPEPTDRCSSCPALPPFVPRLPIAVFLAMAAVLALVAWLLLGRHSEAVTTLRINRAEAETEALRAAARLGLNAGAWKRVTTFQAGIDRNALEYLRLHAAGRQAQLLRENTDLDFWVTRLFRPGHKEEWRFYIAQDRSLIRYDHLLDEQAPGAMLGVSEAKAIAERHVLQLRKMSLVSYRLVESSQDRKDRRTDHLFVWERQGAVAGEAAARLSVRVLGDQPSEARRFLKLPEAWVREYEKPRIHRYLFVGLCGAAAFPLLIVLVRRLGARRAEGRPALPWRPIALLGAAAAAGFLALGLNSWPALDAAYNTAIPYENFRVQMVVGLIISAMILGGAGLASALAFIVFTEEGLRGRKPAVPSLSAATAVAVALLAAGLCAEALHARMPGARLDAHLPQIPGAASWLPGLSAALAPAGDLLWLFAAVAVASAVGLRYLRPVTFLATVLSFAAAEAISRAAVPSQVPWLLAGDLILLLVLWMYWESRPADPASLLAGAYWALSLPRCFELVRQPASGFLLQGILGFLLAGCTGFLVLLWVRRALDALSRPARANSPPTAWSGFQIPSVD